MKNSSSVLLSLPTLSALLALTACKPPPTDADMRRDMPEAAPTIASDPLPSPEIEGAVWAPSAASDGQVGSRIIYGVPGEPALVALECVDPDDGLPELQITRLSPADEGAGALLALVGNGAIGRIAVDAVEVRGRSVWQGSAIAADTVWEPLAGPRQVTLTVPGAGMVTLNRSEAAWELLAMCRNDAAPEVEPPAIELPPVP